MGLLLSPENNLYTD